MVHKPALAGKTELSWLVVVATVITVALFARLGFWQLSRASEKVELLKLSDAASELPPLNRLDQPLAEKVYRTVELQGRFDFERQFLRDNVVFEKQPGLEVLTPYVLDNSSSSGAVNAILVNRGWLPWGPDRQQRPGVGVENELASVRISGILVKPSKGFTLGEAIDPSEHTWPLIVQYLDYETLSARLGSINLLPAVVVLHQDHALGFSYNWRPVADGPEKHYGYAFQWFSMLIAVVGLFIYLNFIKKNEPDTV